MQFQTTLLKLLRFRERIYVLEVNYEIINQIDLQLKLINFSKEFDMVKPLNKVFNFKMTFDDGWRLCDAFGGTMWFPQNDDEIQENLLYRNGSSKTPKNCSTTLWIPIKRSYLES